jgi:tetratricopeptide (TPR) repeat protein
VALGRLFVEEAAIQIQAGAKPSFYQFKLTQARDALVEGISIDEHFASAFYFLGAVDLYSFDYVNAEKELKHALELNSALWEAHITLNDMYMKQKKWNSALDNLEEFLMKNPSSPYRREAEDARAVVLQMLRTAQ